MGGCGSCRYWQCVTEYDHLKDGEQGTCTRITEESGCTVQSLLPKGEHAQVQTNYDHSSSELVTSRYFGCVLHEEKSTNPSNDAVQ